MSAIGDYIHFTRQGYEDYGIGRKSVDKSLGNLLEMRRTMAQAAKIRLGIQNEQGLRNTLDSLTKMAKDIMDTNNPRYKDQRAAVEKYLTEKYANKIKNINWDTGTITPFLESDYGMGQVHWQKDPDDAKAIQLQGKIETLIKKVNALNEELPKKIRELSDAGQVSTARALAEQVKTMNTLYQQAFNLQQEGDQLGIPSSTKIAPAQQPSFKQFQRVINQLIRDYAPLPPKALYEGTLWEAVIAAIGSTATAIGVEEIAKDIDKLVIGDSSIEFAPDSSTFVASKTIEKRAQNASVTATADEKRRKVDVRFTYQGQDLKISAKNITIANDIYKWVSAVSSTNFAALVQGIADPDIINFINHYLNLYTRHGLAPEQEAQVKLAENKEINDTMKAYLFFAGLSGVEKNDFVNIFAIHDKRSGDIKFVLLSDIIDTFVENTQKLSVRLNGTPISKFYFNQKWVDFDEKSDKKPEYQRIAALTHQLHEVKVKASFNIVDTVINKKL